MRQVAIGVLSWAACAAPQPLELPLPDRGDGALVVVLTVGADSTAVAIEPAAPQPIPGTRVDDLPLTVEVLGYARPLAELGLLGAPGPLTLTEVGAGRPLPAPDHVDRRTVTADDDGAWTSAAAPARALWAASVPACAPLDAQPIDVPTDVGFSALFASGPREATLVTEDAAERVAWHRATRGELLAIDDPLPGLRPRDGRVDAAGNTWIVGLRGAAPELWMRPAGGMFVRVPDSPATQEGAETGWLAPFGDGAWTLTRDGQLERYHMGRWDVRHRPATPALGRSFGSIAASGPDVVDAIMPFRFDGTEARTLVHADAVEVTAFTLLEPLPHALVDVPALGGTVVGSAQGRVYRFGARGLEDLAEQTMGSIIQALVPAQHGPWRGVAFAGINGYLRELYVGAEPCVPTGLWFNVGAMADTGDGWIAVGTTQPPARRPSVAWIRRTSL